MAACAAKACGHRRPQKVRRSGGGPADRAGSAQLEGLAPEAHAPAPGAGQACLELIAEAAVPAASSTASTSASDITPIARTGR